MGISDRIAAFITELMKEDDYLELGRNELASIFNCVPSQINYVISTRFSPEKGYIVESRRGGGGYLRIRRISTSGNTLRDIALSIDETLTQKELEMYVSRLVSMNIINEREAALIQSAVSDRALQTVTNKDAARANIVKNMLVSIV